MSINYRYTLAKAHKRAWRRHSIAPPFVKTWGVSFSHSHQTHCIDCSNQAGQLSNLHSLATANGKPAIFVSMSISGII